MKLIYSLVLIANLFFSCKTNIGISKYSFAFEHFPTKLKSYIKDTTYTYDVFNLDKYLGSSLNLKFSIDSLKNIIKGEVYFYTLINNDSKIENVLLVNYIGYNEKNKIVIQYDNEQNILTGTKKDNTIFRNFIKKEIIKLKYRKNEVFNSNLLHPTFCIFSFEKSP